MIKPREMWAVISPDGEIAVLGHTDGNVIGRAADWMKPRTVAMLGTKDAWGRWNFPATAASKSKSLRRRYDVN
jgi:hypothetical protein